MGGGVVTIGSGAGSGMTMGDIGSDDGMAGAIDGGGSDKL
jgi:hypothetical protein